MIISMCDKIITTHGPLTSFSWAFNHVSQFSSANGSYWFISIRRHRSWDAAESPKSYQADLKSRWFFFHTCYCLLLVVADVHLKCLLCQQPLTENHLEADGRPQRGSDTEAVYDGLAERWACFTNRPSNYSLNNYALKGRHDSPHWSAKFMWSYN